MAEETFTLKDYYGWMEAQLHLGASDDLDMLDNVTTALEMMYLGISPINPSTSGYRDLDNVRTQITNTINEAYTEPPEDDDGFLQPFKYRQLKQTQITAQATAFLVHAFAKKIVTYGHAEVLHESNKVVNSYMHEHGDLAPGGGGAGPAEGDVGTHVAGKAKAGPR